MQTLVIDAAGVAAERCSCSFQRSAAFATKYIRTSACEGAERCSCSVQSSAAVAETYGDAAAMVALAKQSFVHISLSHAHTCRATRSASRSGDSPSNANAASGAARGSSEVPARAAMRLARGARFGGAPLRTSESPKLCFHWHGHARCIVGNHGWRPRRRWPTSAADRPPQVCE